MLPITSLITPDQLEKMASRSNFRYGKEIFKDEEIKFDKINTFNLIATIRNRSRETATVELMSTTKGFRWKCTCTNKKGIFCHHCVAVGLKHNQNLNPAEMEE